MIDFFIVLVLSSYILVPAMTLWGWASFLRKKHLSVVSAFSLIGFTLATASELLVVGSAIYARLVEGFGYYDPRLKPIFLGGFLLTAGSIVASLVGVWRKSLLRWLAPACSVGMAILWLYFLAAE